MQKPAVTQVAIDPLLAARWSSLAFDPNKPISPEKIIALVEAAHWAPSSYNDQPWRFIVCDKHSQPQAWKLAFDCLVPANQAWLVHAPLLLIGCANTLLEMNQKPNRFGQYDTGAAAVSLCLQATSMGLMTHQMGGFNADKAREDFAIPAQFTPMAMLAVGYAADASNLPEDLSARETAARKRKPLGELFFNGAWAKPII